MLNIFTNLFVSNKINMNNHSLAKYIHKKDCE
jgi:hypothetical protein